MSINGVRQLKFMTIGYCDYSGSSRGVRQFIRKDLINIAKKYPEVQFTARLRRRNGASLHGKYHNDYSQRMTLANLEPSEVRERVQRLLDKSGRGSMFVWPKARTTRGTLQGIWSPLVNYVKPAERIYPEDYLSAQVKKVEYATHEEVLEFEQARLDEGQHPETVRKMMMSPEQRHRSKTERKFFSGLDNIIKLRDEHGINVIPPVEIRNDPEKLSLFEKDVHEKMRQLKIKLKEDKKKEIKEKVQIKQQLKKEKIYQSWRDNIIIKAKYPFASVRPSILYGEWPPKNPDGTIHRGPLDFALRPNEKFLKHFPHRAADAIIDPATGQPVHVADESLQRSASPDKPPKTIRDVPVEVPRLKKEQDDTKIPYFVKKQWLNDIAKRMAEKREAIYAQRAKQKSNTAHNSAHSPAAQKTDNDQRQTNASNTPNQTTSRAHKK